MKIESSGEEKITVALSSEDMRELDITYDEMDYSNIETRRVIWTILDKARLSLGRSVNPEDRLLIEVSPLENGGCILSFTAFPPSDSKAKKRTVMKKDNEPLLLIPIDLNAYLDMLARVKNGHEDIKAISCYRFDSEIYAVVYPKPFRAQAVSHILSEYGETGVFKSTDLARLLEYGEEIFTL